MMQENCCTFPKIIDGRMTGHAEKCGLYYRTLHELIHHIEEEHIPLIEAIKTAERKQLKEQFANDPEQYEKAYATLISQPVPLSLICKVKPFPKGHKVHPIPPPKPRTLKFCHYKPKPQKVIMQADEDNVASDFANGTLIGPEYTAAATSGRQPIKSLTQKLANVESQSRIRQISTSSESATNDLANATQNDQQQSQPAGMGLEDKKFRCGIEGCLKTYKNQQGLRQHMRSTHNSSLEGTMIGTKLSASEEGILSRQLPGRQSPFVGKSQESIESISTSRPTEKYKCQQCDKEYKGIKAFANYNKHLHDVHQIVLSSPSRYPSPSPIQHVYSPQMSPQRTISTGNMTILPSASKVAAVQLQQQQSAFPSSQSSFVAPTLTARNQQPSFLPHQTARPSAPIPPSTPPSSVGMQQQPQSAMVGYSQLQSAPHQTIIRSAAGQPQIDTSPQRQHHHHHHHVHMADQQQLDPHPHHHQHPQQTPPQPQHYYVTTVDQQPPILQPQQQPTAATVTPSSRYRYASYQQQQQQQSAGQMIQRQQGDPQMQQQQQIYGPGNYAAYPSVSLNPGGGTTTIYVTHQQANLGASPGGQQQNFGGLQQHVEYEHQQQQDNYGRPYYRQQAHYTVEPIQQQQQQIYSPQIQSSPNARSAQAGTIRVPVGGNQQQQYIPQQQSGAMNPQHHQQQHYHAVYAPSRYQGEPMQHPSPQQPQSPYITTIRTAPIQGPQQQQQRMFQHQSQQQPQFYTLPRSHNQNQRQSPATVEAVLASASPASQQGGGFSHQ